MKKTTLMAIFVNAAWLLVAVTVSYHIYRTGYQAGYMQGSKDGMVPANEYHVMVMERLQVIQDNLERRQ